MLVNHQAPVHHSLLEIMLCAGVPYTAALANVAQTVVLVVTLRWWRWLLIGAAAHLLLAKLTGDDPNRLYKLWRYCTYVTYYRPG
jgi:type IV secretory pathway TrbD component